MKTIMKVEWYAADGVRFEEEDACIDYENYLRELVEEISEKMYFFTEDNDEPINWRRDNIDDEIESLRDACWDCNRVCKEKELSIDAEELLLRITRDNLFSNEMLPNVCEVYYWDKDKEEWYIGE